MATAPADPLVYNGSDGTARFTVDFFGYYVARPGMSAVASTVTDAGDGRAVTGVPVIAYVYEPAAPNAGTTSPGPPGRRCRHRPGRNDAAPHPQCHHHRYRRATGHGEGRRYPGDGHRRRVGPGRCGGERPEHRHAVQDQSHHCFSIGTVSTTSAPYGYLPSCRDVTVTAGKVQTIGEQLVAGNSTHAGINATLPR